MLKWLWNALACLGLLTLVILGTGLLLLKTELSQWDTKALTTYFRFLKTTYEKKSIVDASVWRFPVVDGLSIEEIDQSLKIIANEHNLKNVGELPLHQQIKAEGHTHYRFVKIYMFCDAQTAADMLDYNDAYSAFLPCRISLIQDKQGKFWLYTFNMDLMLYGGKPLPPELKQQAERVKTSLVDMMNRTIIGDF